MPIKRVPRKAPSALTTEQKVAFSLLLFLGLGGVFFGFRSFGANIRRPFDMQIAKYLKGEKFSTSTQREEADLEASKTRDVDGDGLTDYDELYVYKTSPYLTDSDSDGFDDKTEIFSGNDPTCPQGTDCKGEVEQAVTEDADLSGLLQGFGGSDAILSAGEVDFKSPEDVQAFFQKATVAEIRKALLQSGLTQEELDLLTDEDIISAFTSTVEDTSAQGGFDALVTQNETAP